jgi:hypothetical protein
MTTIVKSKYSVILPALIAIALVGGFFLKDAKTSFASIADCLSTQGNLITNCSFEIPGAIPPPGYYPHSTGNFMFPLGYTGLTGWKIIAPVKASNVGYLMPGFPTPSGKEIVDLSGFVDQYNLNMNGEQAGSGVEQTVTGLTPGQEYQLTFSQGYLAPFASQIGVYIDGISQGLFDVDATTAGTENFSGVYWKEQSIKFIATSSTATIRFIHTIPQPGGKIVVYGSALDNVILLPIKSRVPTTPSPTPTPVPTPTTPTPGQDGITGILNTPLQCARPGVSIPFGATVTGPGVTSVILEKDTNADGVYAQDTNPPLQTTSWTAAGTYSFNSNESSTYTGIYSLRLVVNGVVRDTRSVRVSPECKVQETPVHPGGPVITPTEPTAYVKSTTIASNYTNPSYATTGHIITLNYSMTKTPTSQRVVLGDQTVDPVCISEDYYKCSAAIIVTSQIPLQDGLVEFSIIAMFGRTRSTTTGTTDGSYVIVDRSGNPLPVTPIEIVPTPTPTNPGVEHPGTPITPVSPTPPQTPSTPSSGGGSGVIPPNVLPQGVVTPASTPNTTSVWGTPYTANGPQSCVIPFTQYLRKGNVDGQRGIFQVGKIQKFLNERLHINLSTDGVFDSLTDQAVRNFQDQYTNQIITPWKLSDPTGWWYQSTRSYANYLSGCSEGPVRLDNGTWLLDGQVIK